MAHEIETHELIACGLDAADAESLTAPVNRALALPSVEAWREISSGILRPEHPFALHKFLFAAAFSGRRADDPPAPAWTPTDEQIRASNVGRMIKERGFADVAQLHAWSDADRGEFWGQMVERLGIALAKPPTSVLDVSDGVERPKWLAGARLNIAESCFQADPGKPAIVYHDESGMTSTVTYGQLSKLVNRVANGLQAAGFRPGDALAIYLPMSAEAVAIYLGIVRTGCVAVSIADSLAAEEIAVRLRLSEAKGVFTQDVLLRGGKPLPLYAKVVEAGRR